MFAEERKMEILQMVKSGITVKVVELSQHFGISESTVRRDLQELEDDGLLQRTHGGAIQVQSGYELSFQEKEVWFLEEKQKIARAAARLVQDGEAILLDAGTTTLEIAKALIGRPITVATNSMDVAQIFLEDDKVEVIVFGGTWRKATRSLVGYLTNEALHRVHFDKVFLAANALDIGFGITTPNANEAETKRHMVQAGKQRVLVVDHSKLGQQGLYQICGLEELDLLLIDDGADSADIEQLRKHVQVIIAGAE